MSKTVYILGAGFSMDAGAPSQARLLEAIFDLPNEYSKKPKSIIHNWVQEVDKFLKEALYVTEAEKKYYTLEDIYTPIDKSLLEATSFRQYTPADLVELRDCLNKLVILAIRKSIEKSKKSRDSIEIFAKHLVTECKKRLGNEKSDTASVITTNWDIMLDNAAYQIINKDTIPKGHKFSGVIDYCCYISSLEESDEKIKPGLYAIGKGRYNVKLLKLHGSLNWLQCPKCQRLYVKLYKRFNGGYIFNENFCRHCEKNYNQNEHKSNLLYTNLITPTFLKNLNNVQNKLIWQNAGVELAEASKIVFLGYSLPQADFEFKQLLSRMVRPDAKIDVVLISSDDPDKKIGNDKYLTAGYRFQNFFSGREINLFYAGVSEYVSKYCR